MPDAPGEPEGMQFDRAEPKEPESKPTCLACQRPIEEQYFEVRGRMACPACKDAMQAEWAGGSKAGRFLKATLYGTLAAALGTGIYFGVLALTGYEVGLIAILVGLLVGNAVMRGSGRRGGLAYQLLAIFLTYGVVAASYGALAFQMIAKEGPPAPPAPIIAPEAPPGAPGVAPAPEKAEEPPPGCLVSIVVLAGLVLAMPVLVGQENILSLVILGFALWQAWIATRRNVLAFAGPFRLGAPKTPETPTGA